MLTAEKLDLLLVIGSHKMNDVETPFQCCNCVKYGPCALKALCIETAVINVSVRSKRDLLCEDRF